MKKIAVLVTAMAIALSGCGADAGNSDIDRLLPNVEQAEVVTPVVVPDIEQMTEITIPWNRDDTLNAYTCSDLQNSYIANLLADPLIVISPTNEIENRLALEILSDPNNISIILRHDLVLPDGSELKAQDVVYSIQLAMGSTRYGNTLSNISRVVAADDYTINISLYNSDIFFVRNLTFPIYPDGSGGGYAPTGIGRFSYNPVEERLERNSTYSPMVENIKYVNLEHIPHVDDQTYALMEGRIQLMYADMQHDFTEGMGVMVRQVPLSNLLFLGVNGSRTVGNFQLRLYMDAVAPKYSIARKSYLGYAMAADTPLNPPVSAYALEITGKNITQQTFFDMGWRATASGGFVSVNMLVLAENSKHMSAANIIVESYKEAGIDVNLVPLGYDDYIWRVVNGEYDLYLGEVAVPNNYQLNDIIFNGGKLNPMAPYSSNLESVYYSVKYGTAPLTDLEKVLVDEKPIIPLVFLRGILSSSRDITTEFIATEQDIFYNIVNW